MSTQRPTTAQSSASYQDQASAAAEQASAAEDGAAPRLSRSAAAPWSMPLKFLPLPKAFSCAGSSTRIDMRSKSATQLIALAARHNNRQGIKEDPFETTLKGIPERAKLRPTSQLAATHTLGSVPADSPYAKAWRSIKRKAVRAAGKGKGTEDAAAKRAEAAATAARLARLQGKPLQEGGRAQPRQQQLVVPPEQVRWRAKLEGFLGRLLQLPQLGPDAPVLDLNRLFLEVMSQGGAQAVAQSAGWQALALNLQRDSALADELAAVYSCYLLPLEQDLPWGFRPARNVDHLETRAQQRASMGPRLANYDAVVYTWQRALAALERVLPWGAEPAPAAVQQQQQEAVQRVSPTVAGALAEANHQQHCSWCWQARGERSSCWQRQT
ncbi:hypothetical protein COO60DRAFT_1101024 [Scenedesmus sp. NREL 46B-D3]|nr:hypothetical protein COO60DRAFT_1101024 [Scenedesmus sp. NREL 46B-D3]